ncbi:MAG: Glucose/arabinose dehydrogenase, beta-propeller fold [Dehalococcoidia bacterium]|nr:Glucose/arabinose dehydrogenase, beta-propeller fold [Dehalococcoidia bacterium]
MLEYPHTGAGPSGIAVIGGFVYRGKALPALRGAYVFGDYSAGGQRPEGKLFIATRPSTPGMWQMRELGITTNPNGQLNAFLRAFGQDASGELYVLTADSGGPSGSTGKVFKIVP